MPPQSATKTGVSLVVHHEQQAALIEELLWTIDGIESVTYQYGPDEKLRLDWKQIAFYTCLPYLAPRGT